MNSYGESALDPNPFIGSPPGLLDAACSHRPSEHCTHTTLQPGAKCPQLSEGLSASAPTPTSDAQSDTKRHRSTTLLSMIPTKPDANTSTNDAPRAGLHVQAQSPPSPSYSPTTETSSSRTRSAGASDNASWQEFLESYAAGHWDALKSPSKPVQGTAPGFVHRSKSFSMLSPHYAGGSAKVCADGPSSSIEEIRRLPVSRGQRSGARPQSQPRLSSTHGATTETLAQRRVGEAMALSQASIVDGPFIDSGLVHSTCLKEPGSSMPGSRSIPDVTQAVTDAATVRLAGANAKVAPLTLSSPESKLSLFPSHLLALAHFLNPTYFSCLGELLDPLRYFVSGASTPLSQRDSNPFDDHQASSSQPPSAPNVPCPTLPIFEHTESSETVIGIDSRSSQIRNSAPGAVKERDSSCSSSPHHRQPAYPSKIHKQGEVPFGFSSPSCSPGARPGSQPQWHGYGYRHRHAHSRSRSSSSLSTDVQQQSPRSPVLVDPLASFPNQQHTALPTKVSITIPPQASSSASVRRGSAPCKMPEEVSFYELGYLVAPRPPDEFDRRKALHRLDLIAYLDAC